jgi:hypothetical protein
LDSAKKGAYLIDMTTTSPQIAEKLYEEGTKRGFHVLDAPVTGGDTGAREGTLSILVGGDKSDYTNCHELFEAMGTNINYEGSAGCGQHCKLANQIMIAGALSPVFAPLGFGDWRISTALVTGFMAKESVVSTLTVLFGTTEALLGTITAAGAAALLVFCLLYTPCVAAVASIKRELGGKWAFFVVIGQCVIAWLAAFAVHTVAMLF